jgi:hypothetical protein
MKEIKRKRNVRERNCEKEERKEKRIKEKGTVRKKKKKS